jgi:hypothetical protein
MKIKALHPLAQIKVEQGLTAVKFYYFKKASCSMKLIFALPGFTQQPARRQTRPVSKESARLEF